MPISSFTARWFPLFLIVFHPPPTVTLLSSDSIRISIPNPYFSLCLYSLSLFLFRWFYLPTSVLLSDFMSILSFALSLSVSVYRVLKRARNDGLLGVPGWVFPISVIVYAGKSRHEAPFTLWRNHHGLSLCFFFSLEKQQNFHYKVVTSDIKLKARSVIGEQHRLLIVSLANISEHN